MFFKPAGQVLSGTDIKHSPPDVLKDVYVRRHRKNGRPERTRTVDLYRVKSEKGDSGDEQQ